MSTPMDRLPETALEVLTKHGRKLGKDYAVIEAALKERSAFDAECRTLRAEVASLRAQRRGLHDEYAMAALKGLLASDTDAGQHGHVRLLQAFALADLAMDVRSTR
ncbi:hypothetical protein [Caldimonas brevitalea]|uniref:Uncharacterized protein n=1 Tax=Caldimonas brevitalea TaxID=413882 RepID=A0A0G3BHG6_9BURK|nr:hypothetical protein [Caldimonas brevitalea]AKJ28772.1 hypothetical protein AAW51_2081 [Caldimonas brevitalea]